MVEGETDVGEVGEEVPDCFDEVGEADGDEGGDGDE